MFALHLDQFTSYKWILNTSASFIISLTLSPFAKVIFVNIILEFFIQRFKEYRRRKQMNYVVPYEHSTHDHNTHEHSPHDYNTHERPYDHNIR